MATCSVCKLPSTEPLVSLRGKKLCPVCLQAAKDAAKAKDTKRIMKMNDPDRQALESFLCQLWSLDALPIGIGKQLDQLAKSYQYADILYALHYFYDLEEHDIPQEPTVGIVPYIIKEATNYRQMIEAASKANASFVADQETTIVTIHHHPGTHQFLGYSLEDL